MSLRRADIRSYQKFPFEPSSRPHPERAKTVLLQSMVLDLYRAKGGKSPFSRIYIWSPSVNVDHAWIPVEEFAREELGVDEDKERL